MRDKRGIDIWELEENTKGTRVAQSLDSHARKKKFYRRKRKKPGGNMSSSALIAAVKKRRSLWDTSDVNHHNRMIVSGLWHEIGLELAINSMTAKSKWRGLRDYYRQQLNRNAEQFENMLCSQWAHMDEMSFLEKTMRSARRTVKTNAPIGVNAFVKTETFSPERMPVTEYSNDATEVGDGPSTAGERNRWSPNSPPCQTAWTEEMYFKHRESDEKSDVDDDDLHFFKSLLPDLKNMPRPKKLLVRLKIQRLLYDEIYGDNA